MTHPVDNSPPDEDRQRTRGPEHPNDDRRSPSYSPRARHARDVDYYSSKPRGRRRDSDRSEDTQDYELHRNRSPRHHRERREQASGSDSGDEAAGTLDTPPRRYRRLSLPRIEQGDVSIQRHSSPRPELVGRNTGGTLPQPSEVLPTVIIPRPGTEEFSPQSSDSESEMESRMSRWEDLVQRGVYAPVPQLPPGPVLITADDRRPRQRRRPSRTHASRRSSGGSETPGSLREAPGLHQAPREVESLAIGTSEPALMYFVI